MNKYTLQHLGQVLLGYTSFSAIHNFVEKLSKNLTTETMKIYVNTIAFLLRKELLLQLALQ